MSAVESSRRRRCPGEKYDITPAICRARQHNHYPKCLLCQFHEAEGGGAESDPRVHASIFRQSCVLGSVPSQINEYVFRKVGAAAVQLIRAGSAGASRIAVAHDLRRSSGGLARALCEGINQAGLDAVSAGAVPEEVLRFVLGSQQFAGGAYVCGGNQREEINGLRLFRGDGMPLGFSNGLDKIGLIARRLRSGRSRMPGQRGVVDPLEGYRSYALKFASALKPLKVVVDACAGSAARTVSFVFEKLPVRLVPSNFDSEGRGAFLGKKFPPPEVSSAVKKAIIAQRAALGAAIDFAGERIVLVDETGSAVRHDAVASLIASEMLHRHQGGRILYDLRASAALAEDIVAAGGQPLRGPTDATSMALEMYRKEALYGADLEGRHFFRDFFRAGSPLIALLMVASFISRTGRKLSRCGLDFQRYRHSGELALKMPSAKVAGAVMDGLKGQFKEADRDLLDGLTVRFGNWWFNVRQPPDSAQLRLNVEGRSPADERRGRERIIGIIKELASQRP